MPRTTLITLSVAALALAGCGHKAETASTDTTTVRDNSTVEVAGSNTMAAGDNMAPGDNMSAMVSPGQAFVNTAAASDAFEIATSKLAATNAESPGIKSFAAKMITAHTASTAKLKTAASSASPALTPDPTMTADQQKTLEELKTKMGAAFDTSYAAAQVSAHQAALDGLNNYAASGGVPQLKSFAAAIVPTVTEHLKMAKALKV